MTLSEEDQAIVGRAVDHMAFAKVTEPEMFMQLGMIVQDLASTAAILKMGEKDAALSMLISVDQRLKNVQTTVAAAKRHLARQTATEVIAVIGPDGVEEETIEGGNGEPA